MTYTQSPPGQQPAVLSYSAPSLQVGSQGRLIFDAPAIFLGQVAGVVGVAAQLTAAPLPSLSSFLQSASDRVWSLQTALLNFTCPPCPPVPAYPAEGQRWPWIAYGLGRDEGDGLKPGDVYFHAGATAPEKTLICNGDTVPNGTGTVQGVTADFSALFAAVGSAHGAPGRLPNIVVTVGIDYAGASAGSAPREVQLLPVIRWA